MTSLNRLNRCASAATKIALVLAAYTAGRIFGAEPKYDYYVPLKPENAVLGHFSATKDPVVKVKSGQTVKIDGAARASWGNNDANTWLKEHGIEGTVESIPTLAETVKVLKESARIPNTVLAHVLVGPIYVEGAEPGDSLEIQIVAQIPRIDYGVNSGTRGGGSIPDLLPVPYARVIKFDLKKMVALFDKNTVIPLAPFNGIMANCPSDAEGPNRGSRAPGVFGGNLDCKELVAGTSLFLPVFQKGALFYTGDCHAGQGDGEVSGTAMETANTSYLRFVLHKGKNITAPRAENAGNFMCFGIDPDLNKSMQMAVKETVTYLQEKRGLNLFDAYALTSTAVDFRVTQFVDLNLGVHSMIRKSLFSDLKDDFWAKK